MTDRPTDPRTEARLRDFLSAELAQARLDFTGLAPRPRPRPTSSFAPLVAVSVMAVIALVAAGLLASRSWPDPQGAVAATSTSAPATCEPEDLGPFLESIQTVIYDYQPFDTPRDLADAADLVVVGRFVTVGPGRSTGSRGQRGLLTIAVETVVAGNRSALQDGRVVVELPMQPSDIETARESLPTNRVMLFLILSSAPIYQPFVQGVVLETCPGYLSALDSLENMSAVWRQAATFDEFIVLASQATSPSPSPASSPPAPSPTGTPAPPDGARLRIQPTVEEWGCTPAGCKYYADLTGPGGSTHRMELSLGGGLDLPVVGPDQILPVLLDPGRYRLTLESLIIDDVSFVGQPPEVTLGARCIESIDVVPGQTEVWVRVAFGIDSCEVSTTLEPH